MSEAAPIDVVMNEDTRRFEVTLDGETAFAEYRLVDHGIILPHTVVPEAFEGKGVGSALAKAALGYARKQELKVIPLCPFIAAYITKHPEWHDLVHETYRARLGID
ncbi:GNAT family N-acetyltransferase [Phenylobacterium sp.]|uniref:GNAT family N-acetyltransferase n=1 Tax=Phenylobacterium sp. TaxID=1871053 RepID=UPI0035B0B4A3